MPRGCGSSGTAPSLISCRAVLHSPGGRSKPQSLSRGSWSPARLGGAALGRCGVQPAQSWVGSGAERRPDSSTWLREEGAAGTSSGRLRFQVGRCGAGKQCHFRDRSQALRGSGMSTGQVAGRCAGQHCISCPPPQCTARRDPTAGDWGLGAEGAASCCQQSLIRAGCTCAWGGGGRVGRPRQQPPPFCSPQKSWAHSRCSVNME